MGCGCSAKGNGAQSVFPSLLVQPSEPFGTLGVVPQLQQTPPGTTSGLNTNYAAHPASLNAPRNQSVSFNAFAADDMNPLVKYLLIAGVIYLGYIAYKKL